MMNERGRVALSVLMLLAAAGCQTSVHQVRLDRVDQSLEGGNRGYLIGTPPELADRGTLTREITELEIQLPSGARRTPAKRRATPVPAAEAPSTEEAEAQAVATDTPFTGQGTGTVEFLPPSAPAPAADGAAASQTSTPAPLVTRYTVKKGDSLWKIAKQFYGDPYQWRRIYDANRAQLPHPDRVRPGMTLHIPTSGSPAVATRPSRHHHTHTKKQRAAPAVSTESDLK